MNIETAVFTYLRFKRQYELIATECGNAADILAIKGKFLTEVEVKRTRGDFNNDFRNKPENHKLYNDPDFKLSRRHTYKRVWVPHKFYFAVPEDLGLYVREKLEKEYPKYGLFAFTGDKRNLNCALTVSKKASFLHKNELKTDIIVPSMTSRMSSMIGNFMLNGYAKESMYDALDEYFKKDINAELE